MRISRAPPPFDSSRQCPPCHLRRRHCVLPAGTKLLAGLSAGKSINRAVHFAGGLLKAKLDGTGETYSVELWFWNGLPVDVRPITGYVLSCGSQRTTPHLATRSASGERKWPRAGSFFPTATPPSKILAGKTEITPKTWHHLALVRERGHVTVYLDGNLEPEIAGDARRLDAVGSARAGFIGGRSDGLANFEGKIDEVALYDRALGAAEVAGHVRAANASSGSHTGGIRLFRLLPIAS